ELASTAAHLGCGTAPRVYLPPSATPATPATVMTGFVWSMFIGWTVTDALLPALSTAVPVTCWLAPSAVSVTGSGQLWTPDSASLQVKVTVTAVLFHPARLGAGLAVAVIVGG